MWTSILFSFRLGGDLLASVDFADSHIVQVLQPTVAGLCQLNVEHASIDNLSHWHLAIVAFNHLGSVVELLDQ